MKQTIQATKVPGKEMPLSEAFPGKQFKKLAPAARLVDTVFMTKGPGPVDVASLNPMAKVNTVVYVWGQWARIQDEFPFRKEHAFGAGHIDAAALSDKLWELDTKIGNLEPQAFTPNKAIEIRTLAHEAYKLVKRLERSGIVGMRNGDYKKPIAEVLENIRDICMEIPSQIIKP